MSNRMLSATFAAPAFAQGMSQTDMQKKKTQENQAVEPNAAKRELAMELGATHTIDPKAEDARKKVREITMLGTHYALACDIEDQHRHSPNCYWIRGFLSVARFRPDKEVSMLALHATALLMACCFTSAAGAADGLIAVPSPYSVKETIDRFETAAESRGINIFLRIDHAQGARNVGKDLRPTELLVFGNPQGGTPLMECAQTAGIDLPLKALAWQDAIGQVWLGYNDPQYLASRHGANDCGPVVENMSNTLNGMTQEAIQE